MKKLLHEEMLAQHEDPMVAAVREDYERLWLMSERALHLCHAIERSPASEQLTKCSLLAAQLRKELELYEQTRPMTTAETKMIDKAWRRFSGQSNTKPGDA